MFVDHDETINLHFSETELLKERMVVLSFSILDTMDVLIPLHNQTCQTFTFLFARLPLELETK
jgi:hypothetical protein